MLFHQTFGVFFMMVEEFAKIIRVKKLPTPKSPKVMMANVLKKVLFVRGVKNVQTLIKQNSYFYFTQVHCYCSLFLMFSPQFSGLKPGYAGVGLYSKVKPIKVTYGLGTSEFDSEGRLITAEYEKFYLVNVCKFFLLLQYLLTICVPRQSLHLLVSFYYIKFEYIVCTNLNCSFICIQYCCKFRF